MQTQNSKASTITKIAKKETRKRLRHKFHDRQL